MFRAVLFQLVAAALSAALAGVWVGGDRALAAALSAVWGGMSYALPSLFFAVRLSVAAKAGRASGFSFFIGEFFKVAATIGLLAVAAFGASGLVWPAMVFGLFAALQAGLFAFWKKS